MVHQDSCNRSFIRLHLHQIQWAAPAIFAPSTINYNVFEIKSKWFHIQPVTIICTKNAFKIVRNTCATLYTAIGLLNARASAATVMTWPESLNIFRPEQDGRLFADDIFKCIFMNDDIWISIKIPLKFIHKGLINNSPALVQILAWRRPGDKPLSEPMLVSLLTHICVTWPHWFK